MIRILLFMFLVLFACKPKQELVEANRNISETSDLKIDVAQNEKIIFTLKNSSESSIYIYELRKLKIEKYVNGAWDALRILPCPCDAPCHPGNAREELLTGESFVLSWNMEESWCGKTKVGNVRETIRRKVGKGKYRLLLSFTSHDNIRKTIYKEFIID